MIFYFNSKGEPLSMIHERVFQGSNKASRLYFTCATLKDNVVSVAFTLPDGRNTERHAMLLANEKGLSGVFDSDGKQFNAWSYDLPSEITQKTGTVSAQFFITAQGGEVTSTATVQFFVERGITVLEPEQGDSYQELTDATINMTAKANEALDYVKSFEELELPQKIVYKVDRSNVLYGTDENGHQMSYPITEHVNVNKTNLGVTDVEEMILTNHEYYYGTLTSATFSLSGDGEPGDMFYICFRSGEVATQITVVGNYYTTEKIYCVPECVMEISGVWTGTKWSLIWRQL